MVEWTRGEISKDAGVVMSRIPKGAAEFRSWWAEYQKELQSSADDEQNTKGVAELAHDEQNTKELQSSAHDEQNTKELQSSAMRVNEDTPDKLTMY